ncbi:hypothetical protein COLO4_04981 [Corchorus olitorius]|uniref:Uncharacterized protein n=1 Tax=Corchorus olitorius TaxID=93759 RepID=A0A1R3KS76_9ROSI|nr:hypothetical protein COLO4_04981 [Corchorus olitorius]
MSRRRKGRILGVLRLGWPATGVPNLSGGAAMEEREGSRRAVKDKERCLMGFL